MRRLITRHVCWRALGKGHVPLPRLGRMERCPCGKRDAREGGDGLGGEHRRGHSSALGSRLSALGSRLSALGSLSYAADNAAQNSSNASPNPPGKLRGDPGPPARSETILRIVSPSRSGPRFDKRGEVRSPPATLIFLKGSGSVLCEAFPGTDTSSHSLCCPLKSMPGNLHRAPAAAGTLPALTPDILLAHALTLRIPCRPLRRAAIRTRFPTRCRFGRRLTETQVPS